MTTTITDQICSLYDQQAVHDWLTTLHGRSTGQVWIGSDLDRFRGRTYDTADPGWAGRATDRITRLDQAGAAGIYTRTTTLVAPPRKGRGSDHDSAALPGVAADLDIAGPGHKTTKPLPPDEAAVRDLIDDSGLLTPSLWVHSGGGMYAWWLLAEPAPIRDHERAAAFTDRWQQVIAAVSARHGYTYGNVGDLSRILRVPGTVNRKTGTERPCRIVEDTGRRYSLANLADNLTDVWPAIAPAAPVAPAVPRRPLAAGTGNPGIDYEQQVDWADILEPHGWTFAYEHGHARYWVRPGKDRRGGISATTGRDPARDRLWVFTDATEFPQNTPMTKFGAYTLLNFGGTSAHHFAEAARELRRLGYGGREAA
ncbi:hypothetical protein [Dactylosporangium sp. CA-139066]|uniref:hypothetical protein n=1 Tax=Dactylosporangium sp. CA-139066 TaxID=3239930 RepID=UPI003D91DB06